MKTRNIALFILLAIGLLVYPVAAFSQEAAEPEVVAVEAAPVAVEEVPVAVEAAPVVVEVASLSGTIISLDVAEQSVVIESKVEGQEGSTTSIFYFSEIMKVMKNGEEVASSDLKAGDKVSVEYQADADNNKVINMLVIEE